MEIKWTFYQSLSIFKIWKGCYSVIISLICQPNPTFDAQESRTEVTMTETNEIQISHPLYLSGCIKKSQFRLEQSQKDRIPWKNLKGRGATERERREREEQESSGETGRLYKQGENRRGKETVGGVRCVFP